MAWLSDNLRDLLVAFVDLLVVIGFPGHDRFFLEIESCRWRLRLPLESGCVPRIVGCRLAVAHRPEEINHGEQIADAEDRSARGREDVENLELGHVTIVGVTARHAEIPEDELGEEGQVEPDKYDQRCEAGPAFGIEFAGYF